MTLNLSKENRIYKKLFKLKPPQRDGLILNLHYTAKNSKIRFNNCCFNKNGHLALSDHEGTIFIIDLNSLKFWNLPKILNSCAIIEFSSFNPEEIIAGDNSGRLCVINIENGFISGELKGHECPVINISFANNFLCLTASICEAILWDLRTNTKFQVLNLDHACTLKNVSFIPATNDILTCFNDDVIQIWQFGTFDVKNQIPPMVWFNHEVKNITFTIDGKMMVLGCRNLYLAVFLLSNFKLLKFVTLPEFIQTLKHVDFIPQLNDGGSNKILAILSGRGVIYFYDIDQNIIISELASSYEISKFDFSTKYISCVLCSGDVNVYNLMQYIVVPIELIPIKATKRKKKCINIGVIKEQIRDILGIEKLRLILKECGEYPDSYRVTIWEHLLELPNNKQQYNAIINNRMIVSFEDLCRKYPLQNKRCLKNLKQLLDNLVTWCPFFLNVDYLPLFVFPFIKVFINKPLSCFEAVCTIIVNWCQFWFEYFPLPPVNILAMIENILMEHDPDLLNFLSKMNITSQIYAWPILKTAFSEIFTAKNWKIFWDHVLTNEPAFLLCGAVAYNILQKPSVLNLKDEKQLICFYNTHHPVDVKKLLAKAYHILANTSASIHPRQYLNMFRKLNTGEYPEFCDYPKTAIDFKSEKSKQMDLEMKRLKSDEIDLFKERLVTLEKLQSLDLQKEENERILEMENAIRRQLTEEQTRLHNYYERVANLRQHFLQEDEILTSLRNKIAKEQQRKSRRKYLSSILADVRFRKSENDYNLTKTEDDLLFHYSELLKHKYKLEKLLPDDEILTSTRLTDVFSKQQEQLAEEVNGIMESDKREEYLKVKNLAVGVEAVDKLIEKIEEELEREKQGVSDESVANRRVFQLQAETKELASEVSNLIKLLVDLKNVDG